MSSRRGSSVGSRSSYRDEHIHPSNPQNQIIIYADTPSTIVPGVQYYEEEHYYDYLRVFLDTFNWMKSIRGEHFYPQLIQDFYSHARVRDDKLNPQLEANVSGVRFTLNCQVLSTIFNIPNDGPKIFFGNKFNDHVTFERNCFWNTILNEPQNSNKVPKKKLAREFYILNRFITTNILPKGGNLDLCTFFQCFIMHRIVTNEKLNLPFIILKKMIKMVQQPELVRGFGTYLTKIFKFFHVPILVNPGKPLPICNWKAVKHSFRLSQHKIEIDSCVDEDNEDDNEDNVLNTLQERSYHYSQYQRSTSNVPGPSAQVPTQDGQYPTQNIADPNSQYQDFPSFYFGNSGY